MVIALLIAGALGAAAPTSPNDGKVFLVGPAAESCGTWLSDQRTRHDAETWVLGFWSGLNFGQTATVGVTSDAAGILGEVDKECRDQPSERLLIAVNHVYERLKALSR